MKQSQSAPQLHNDTNNEQNSTKKQSNQM